MAGVSEFTEDAFIRYLRVRYVLERAIQMVEVATFKKLEPALTDEDILATIDRINFFGGAYGSVPYKNTEEWKKFNEVLTLYASMPIGVAFIDLSLDTQSRLRTSAESDLLAEAKQRKEQWEEKQRQIAQFSVKPSSSCGFAVCRGGRTKRSRKQRKTKRRARR